MLKVILQDFLIWLMKTMLYHHIAYKMSIYYKTHGSYFFNNFDNMPIT